MKLKLNGVVALLLVVVSMTAIGGEGGGGDHLLSDDELWHEKELVDLNKATELAKKRSDLVKEKVVLAKLLNECKKNGGTDCYISVNQILVVEKPALVIDSKKNGVAIPKFAPVKPILVAAPPVVIKPILMAVQNNSASLLVEGGQVWVIKGDVIGRWRVITVEASRVRLLNLDSNKVLTLIKNWSAGK